MDKDYGHYCRPGLYQLLEALSLNAVYNRAQGDRLWQVRGEQLIEILDLTGGYGGNLFGHNHPELLEEARRLLDKKVPFLAQGSCRSGAAQLAKALCRLLGDYVVIFTNSGTETVEAAIKHAYLERQKPKIWAVKGSFHGKTLGSIQLTWFYHQPFANWFTGVRFLDPDDPATWENALKDSDQVSAVFIEPILGEGGIKPLSKQFINWLIKTCQKNSIALIVDEIQTGIGRTGSFLASQSMGIDPDYVCLSKSLGGSLTKIGALLIKRNRFVERFSVIHTSTFAEDDFSCFIALKALEILERDNLPHVCAVKGEIFLKELEAIHQRFPHQIKEIRGRGLMIGIELQEQANSASNVLRMLSQQRFLGYLASAYFLNVHQIRIAPTLSQPLTLRIEPSAYIAKEDIDYFINSCVKFCEALEALDVKHLTCYQVGLSATSITDHRDKCHPKRESPETNRRVAFLGNLILPEHAIQLDPALSEFQKYELEAYLAKTSKVLGPTIFDQINVRSKTGEIVHLSFIGLNLTARQIMTALREKETEWIIEKINAAAALARDEGCQVLGLGGHTSIVTLNGLFTKSNGIALTSGNSLTVGMGISALKRSAKMKKIDLSDSRLAVLGALGNIASIYAVMMAPEVKEMVLIVRNLNSSRLSKLINDIRSAAPTLKLSTTDDLEVLKKCSLIVASSNSPDPLIYPADLSYEPVIILDISMPSDVAETVTYERPNALVFQGGIVRLPKNDDFTIGGIPLEKGHVFACMAETLLMGLEGITVHGSYGKMNPQNVQKMLKLAEKHGFKLGKISLKSQISESGSECID